MFILTTVHNTSKLVYIINVSNKKIGKFIFTGVHQLQIFPAVLAMQYLSLLFFVFYIYQFGLALLPMFIFFKRNLMPADAIESKMLF